MSDADTAPPGVDVTRPSAARLYDYYLGGTANFEVDRVAAEQIREKMPELSTASWANRGFLQRAARWLAAEAGVRQFLDLGAGLPTQNNTHEAVQRVAPEATVVYVDNDPEVATHAHAVLDSASNTGFVTADLRDPGDVLDHPDVRRLIDFDQPVAVLMVAVVHFLPDEVDPADIIGRYVSAVVPGSYLALSHITGDRVAPSAVQAIRDVYAKAPDQIHFRTKADVAMFFDGLEFVTPHAGATTNLCFLGCWGAEDPDAADDDGSRWGYCGVARKPADESVRGTTTSRG